MNQLSCIASLLHRDLSDSGKRLSVLLKRGGGTHDEYLWMSWYGEIVLHFDSSRVIRLHRQPLPRRRWTCSSRPDHSPARESFTGHNDTSIIDLIDSLTQPHLHTEPFEPLLGGAR